METCAAVLRRRSGPFVLENLELAGPGAGQVLVRVAGAGFCPTDRLVRRRGFAGRPPVVVGHEGAGVVVAVGAGVTDVRPGAHVVIGFDHCGDCAPCRTGHPAHCTTFHARNFTGRPPDGRPAARDSRGSPVATGWFGQSSFASHAVASARAVVEIGPDLPLATMSGLVCGVQTGAATVLRLLAVPPGASVLVLGCGTVGLSAVMAARIAGAARIVAVDRLPVRLSLAGELGATHTLGSAAPEAWRLAAGGGVDFAVDTTGRPDLVAAGVAALRPGGTLTMVSSPARALRLPGGALSQGKRLQGTVMGDADPARTIPELIGHWRAGRLPFERLVRTYPLDRINEAERDAATGAVVKPVLLPPAR